MLLLGNGIELLVVNDSTSDGEVTNESEPSKVVEFSKLDVSNFECHV